MDTLNYNYFPEKEKLISQLEKLPKKNITLKMVDFDDTLFSRYEQLNGTDKNSILLQNNRGLKCLPVINEAIGIEKYIEQYFTNKKFPTTIIDTLDSTHDVILTAGDKGIQTAKIQATGLDYFNIEIVLKGEDKPQKLIEYIIKLGFIPENIEIYEDRTQHFEATKNEIKEITNSLVNIYLVKMKNNNTPPIITKL